MYALVWLRSWSKGNDFSVMVSDNLSELLDKAEGENLSRRDYGRRWFVMETMLRNETFTGPKGTIKPEMLRPEHDPEPDNE